MLSELFLVGIFSGKLFFMQQSEFFLYSWWLYKKCTYANTGISAYPYLILYNNYWDNLFEFLYIKFNNYL
ncbi:hypothetical protein SAMN05192529_1552 [Arachidicoccus rhizosphaerae]|uniref:Uncharacterized protein n=1 Tax=Arachidicoccus rhizosphaerae TaxID=551991 RepID=A0A1H4D9J9_9BACT|nr:hypothetical protein SAMN05192529_1552 [Arachidicoccus rhizosphaerae]